MQQPPLIKKIKIEDTSLLVQTTISKYCKRSPKSVLLYDYFDIQQFGPLHGDSLKSEYMKRYNFVCDILFRVNITYDKVETIECEIVDDMKTNVFVYYNNKSDDLCIVFEYDDNNDHIILTDLRFLEE